PARQRTLAATIGGSIDLLRDDDGGCFDPLGVFWGGADLEAVAAVLGSESAGAAMLLVEALSDQSLAAIDEGPAGEPRVSMLSLVREAAAAGLDASGGGEAARRPPALHYVALGEAAEERLRGPDGLLWSDRLAVEQDNLHEAYEWCMRTADPEGRALAVRLATALGWYWYTHGSAAEGRARIEAAISDVSGVDPET